MKIVKSVEEEQESKKQRKIVIISISAVCTAILAIGIFVAINISKKPEEPLQQASAEPAPKNDDQTFGIYQEEIGLEEGQDIQEYVKEVAVEVDEVFDNDLLGQVPPDSLTQERYKGAITKDKIEEKAKELKSSDEEVLGYGSMASLIAAATLETDFSMKYIKQKLEENTADPINNYDHHLLSYTLQAIETGELDIRSEIDDFTFRDHLGMVKEWLYYTSEIEPFSWHLITQSNLIYDSVLKNKYYEIDFSGMSDQVISLKNTEIQIDKEYVMFEMIFKNNGKTYKGIYAIRDHLPRVIDIKPL